MLSDDKSVLLHYFQAFLYSLKYRRGLFTYKCMQRIHVMHARNHCNLTSIGICCQMIKVFYYIIFKHSYTVKNIGEAYSNINACDENKTDLFIHVMHARNHCNLTSI